ncbi:hypothetical protein ACU686_32790 [Yinghuangia aomiensis]
MLGEVLVQDKPMPISIEAAFARPAAADPTPRRPSSWRSPRWASGCSRGRC